MGKPTGFLEYGRIDGPVRKEGLRIFMNSTSCFPLKSRGSRLPAVWTAEFLSARAE